MRADLLTREDARPVIITYHTLVCTNINHCLRIFWNLNNLKGEGLTENSIERRKERLGKPTKYNVNYLRDKELANEWRDFHGKNANLKPQSAKENLTQKKQKVDMKPVIAPHLWK